MKSSKQFPLKGIVEVDEMVVGQQEEEVVGRANKKKKLVPQGVCSPCWRELGLDKDPMRLVRRGEERRSEGLVAELEGGCVPVGVSRTSLHGVPTLGLLVALQEIRLGRHDDV